MLKCPICQTELVKKQHVDGPTKEYECIKCDPYYDKPKSIYSISHFHLFTFQDGSLSHIRLLTQKFSIYYYEKYGNLEKTFHIYIRDEDHEKSLRMGRMVLSLSSSDDISQFDWRKHIEKWEIINIFLKLSE